MPRSYAPMLTLISYMFLLAGLIYLSCPVDVLDREGGTKSGFFEAMH